MCRCVMNTPIFERLQMFLINGAIANYLFTTCLFNFALYRYFKNISVNRQRTSSLFLEIN